MKVTQAILLVIGGGAVCYTVALGVYRWKIGPELSADPQRWGMFGDYLGGVLNPLFAIVNIAVVIYIAYRIRQMEAAADRARRESEQRLNAVRLLDTVQSTQFYVAIAAPVYEIAVKWKYWRTRDRLPSEEGDQYRIDVVRGFVSFSSKYESGIQDPKAYPQGGHNIIRFGDHYHPVDYAVGDHRPAYVQTALSEHQALTSWLEWWGQVSTMLHLRLVEPSAVKLLLADWYSYWVEFAVVFRRVVEKLHESLPPSDDGMPEPKPHWIKELDHLESVFYPAEAPDELSRYYRGKVSSWETDAADIADRLLPQIKPDAESPVREQAETEAVAAPDRSAGKPNAEE